MAKDLNRYFAKEYIQMAKKHMKRCSTSYILRELQIKITMKYYYTPIRMAKIQNTDDTKCWWGCEETGTHSLLVEMQNGTATLEGSLAVSYKLNILTLSIWSSNSTPWYLPKGAEDTHGHKNLYMDIYSRFLHNCQNLEATKMPSKGEWINKLWYIQTMVYYSAVKEISYQATKRQGGTLKAYY